MIIEVNKDIESYQESVVMGLTAKQLLFSIASVVVGGALILLLYPYTGLTLSVYIAIPVIAPIALGGFYTYNGMNFYEYVRRKMHFAFLNRAYTYASTEGEAEIVAYRNEMMLQERQRQSRSRKGRGLKKNERWETDKKEKVKKKGGKNHGVIQ